MANKLTTAEAVEIKRNIERTDASLSLSYILEDNNFEQILSEWEYNKSLNREFINKASSSKIMTDFTFTIDKKLVAGSSFFLLFHHYLYFSIPYKTCKLMGYKGICMLITEQSYDINLIKKTALSLGIEAEVIILDSRGHFLRKALKLVKQDYAIFMPADMPFGFDQKGIKEYFYNQKLNSLKYRDGYLRVARALKQLPILLVNDVIGDDEILIKSYPIRSSDNLNEQLCLRVLKEPEKFEKLNDFKKLFNFPVPDKEVSFHVFDKIYTYWPKKQQLFLNI